MTAPPARTAATTALRSVGPRSPIASSSRQRIPHLTPPPSRSMATSTPRSRAQLDQVDHIQTSTTAKLLLTAGSALGLLNNPARGDLLSILTQVSSPPSLPHLLALMRSTESGRRLLVEKPSINSNTVDLPYLSSLPRGTFGREWVQWLRDNRVGPDGRAEADYMPTPEQKYVVQRYRESHDFYHLLLRMPVTQLGETVIKYFEVAQMRMPVAAFAAAGGTIRMFANGLRSLPRPSSFLPSLVGSGSSGSANDDDGGRATATAHALDSKAVHELAMLRTLVPWATEVGRTAQPLIGVEWERCWERDIEEMRAELGISRPPVEVPPFAGRRSGVAKRRGWPSKILEAQREQEREASAAAASEAAAVEGKRLP